LKREQVSNFICGDIRGAKTLMDTTITNETGFNGYIQDIDHTPFGFLMFSEIQVIHFIL
jgi:hypothetical protein